MLILALCVLANVALVICFKMFPRLGVDAFSAIVLNYWVSAAIGCAMMGEIPLLSHVPFAHAWTGFAILLGVVFTTGFYIISKSVHFVGMAITSAMQKMSLLLPTAYAILVFDETAGLLKVSGVVLAVIAIALVTKKDDISLRDLRKMLPYLILPFGALIFSGFIETVLYYIEAKALAVHGDMAFTTYAFSVAGVLGMLVLIYRSATGRYRVTWKDLAGGIVLGTPNFFSIYLILVLLSLGYPGSTLYPVLNILILCVSVLTGVFLFRERLNALNITGLVLALTAILMVSFG